MLNFSIMPLDKENVEEVAQDIIRQQKDNVSTYGLFSMTFHAEGNPVVDKAKIQCQTFDEYKRILDENGAKYGVLAQSTIGHFALLAEQHPFQHLIDLDGNDYKTASCPFDKGFQKYIKGQMKELASHGPSVIMLDDDVGLIYRIKGCTCPLHMAEFNRRAGTNFTREELKSHLNGDSEQDKKYQKIFVEVQKDSLIEAVSVMREGVDEVDPSIMGAVSGISPGCGYVEFTNEIAPIFSGKGNPVISRLNGGIYTNGSGREYTPRTYRNAALRENLDGVADYILAELDTCPHNRYSTSATFLHMHYVCSILEGANGAKMWLTRTMAHEMESGKAYRKILSKYNKFYDKLSEYVKDLRPVGARIPIGEIPRYAFNSFKEPIVNIVSWSTRVLENIGVPIYFSSKKGGAVFIDDNSVDDFTNETFNEFFKGTLVLSSRAAEKLNKRGFKDLVGVDVREWTGLKPKHENILGHKISCQVRQKELVPINDKVQALSMVMYNLGGEIKPLFPGVTGFENKYGGYTVVFSGTPDTEWTYFTAFSLLNQTRKEQIVSILQKQGNLPVYYPEDAEVMMTAGYLSNGELMCTFINKGLDVIDEISLVVEKEFTIIEKLNPDGTRSKCDYCIKDGKVYLQEQAGVMLPVILFIS